MNKEKAIARLEKAGAKVEVQNDVIYAMLGKRTIYVGVNSDGECHSYGLVLGYDDAQQESEVSWRDNLTQAIKAAKERESAVGRRSLFGEKMKPTNVTIDAATAEYYRKVGGTISNGMRIVSRRDASFCHCAAELYAVNPDGKCAKCGLPR